MSSKDVLEKNYYLEIGKIAAMTFEDFSTVHKKVERYVK